jgi:AcrR family transcriptional regulator
MATLHQIRRGRRTQEERSQATRALLLDATLASLEEVGYGRTSTVEVARRAGVSRGAHLHHFPTKAELVADAVRHLFARRHAEFLEAFRRLDRKTARLDAAIDLLWSMVRGPTFVVWLELVVAARTDPELARAVHALSREFQETVEETFRALFPGADDGNPFVEVAPHFAFSLLEGMALTGLATGVDGDAIGGVAALKRLARLVLPQTMTGEPR